MQSLPYTEQIYLSLVKPFFSKELRQMLYVKLLEFEIRHVLMALCCLLELRLAQICSDGSFKDG